MVRIKTEEEIKILREGGKILARVLRAAAGEAKDGVTTAELEDVACRMIETAGGRPAFKGVEMSDGKIFPTTLCIAINDEVVHGPALPARELKYGDIVGIDIGMEYPIKRRGRGVPVNKFSKLGGYYTDMAKTVIIGEVDAQTEKLVNTTKKSLELAIKQVLPGNTLNDIGRAVQEFVEAQGFSIVRELVGHGVGHEYHEEPQVPNFIVTDGSIKNITLKPGMVIAIEPMVNMGGWKIKNGEDGFTIKTADESLSAHFEHTIAITGSGNKVITRM